jgi:ADP-ribose pyrophosphatase YjhB (NUDIX family)
MKEVKKIIKTLEASVDNPNQGLPDDIFYFIGRMTPYINVDLLIKCPIRGVLLTWRDDKYAGRGWHFPGGIVRFRETIKNRVIKVAFEELDILVSNLKGPITTNEVIIRDQVERSHFISLLYECTIKEDQFNKIIDSTNTNSKIFFFKKKPKDLLPLHEIYKDFF